MACEATLDSCDIIVVIRRITMANIMKLSRKFNSELISMLGVVVVVDAATIAGSLALNSMPYS